MNPSPQPVWSVLPGLFDPKPNGFICNNGKNTLEFAASICPNCGHDLEPRRILRRCTRCHYRSDLSVMW